MIFNKYAYTYYIFDILLHGCCTRFSCTLIKRCSQLAKLMIPPPYHYTPFPPLLLDLINKRGTYYQAKLTTTFSCQYIHLYPISIYYIHMETKYVGKIHAINLYNGVLSSPPKCIKRIVII